MVSIIKISVPLELKERFDSLKTSQSMSSYHLLEMLISRFEESISTLPHLSKLIVGVSLACRRDLEILIALYEDKHGRTERKERINDVCHYLTKTYIADKRSLARDTRAVQTIISVVAQSREV